MKRMMMMAAMAVGTACSAFAAKPTLSVTNVTMRQRYPWNGLVDIDCTVECGEPATNVTLYVCAKDTTTGKPLVVRDLWLEGDATHTNALEVKSGTHRLVWDAGKDNPNLVSDAVTIDVLAVVGGLRYMVVDLSGGAAAESYPVSYLSDVPPGGWTDEYKTTKLVLRLIDPGTFTMGCHGGEFGYHDGTSEISSQDAEPHEVTISQHFYMGVFEVTQKQYEQVTGSNPSSYRGDARPVEKLSYVTIRGDLTKYEWPASSDVDPSSFVGKLRAKTGIGTFDLPSEAKWEYACRAGTTTSLNSGKDLTDESHDANMDEVGRYYYDLSDGRGGYTNAHTTVGSYLPNAWGLYDMHGNVQEMCLDYHCTRDDFGTTPVTDPTGFPPPDSFRIRHRCDRGGCWASPARSCRSAYRTWDDATFGNVSSGFRLCCSGGL